MHTISRENYSTSGNSKVILQNVDRNIYIYKYMITFFAERLHQTTLNNEPPSTSFTQNIQFNEFPSTLSLCKVTGESFLIAGFLFNKFVVFAKLWIVLLFSFTDDEVSHSVVFSEAPLELSAPKMISKTSSSERIFSD